MSLPALPHIRAAAVGPGGQLTPEFYSALSQTVTSLRDQITTVAAVVNAITDGTGDLQSLGSLLASKQDASTDLDAIAEIIGGGLVSRSVNGDWNTRVLQPPTAGMTIGNADGRDGNPTFALAADLAAVEGLTTTGVAVRTAASTWTTRTLTGTAGRVTVANGDGVAGAPTVDLATVTDAGGGALLRFVRDAWGRLSGTSAATTTDLAEGTNLYHTTARARAAAVVDTLTDGVLDVAPSQNAVVDALALKANAANPDFTGDVKATGGRIYGTALHNNASGLAGTANQYVGSGTYTPTLTIGTNIDAITAYSCQWMRVGNVVTVSGRVDVDAATGGGTLTYFDMSLPIASDFTAANQCGGGSVIQQATFAPITIIAEISANSSRFLFNSNDTVNANAWFSFTYLVV